MWVRARAAGWARRALIKTHFSKTRERGSECFLWDFRAKLACRILTYFGFGNNWELSLVPAHLDLNRSITISTYLLTSMYNINFPSMYSASRDRMFVEKMNEFWQHEYFLHCFLAWLDLNVGTYGNWSRATIFLTSYLHIYWKIF